MSPISDNPKDVSESGWNAFWLYCSGADIDALQLCTSDTNHSYIKAGRLVFIVAFMALFSSTYAFYSVLTDSYTDAQADLQLDIIFYHNWQFWLALIMGVVWSFLVFSLDQVFLSPSSTRLVWVFFARLVIAVILSKAISMPVELLLFHSKIERKMVDDEQEAEQEISRSIDREIHKKDSIITARESRISNITAEHSPLVSSHTVQQIQAIAPVSQPFSAPRPSPLPADADSATKAQHQQEMREWREGNTAAETARFNQAKIDADRREDEFNKQNITHLARLKERDATLNSLRIEIDTLVKQRKHLQKERQDALNTFKTQTASIYLPNLVNSYSALDALCQPVKLTKGQTPASDAAKGNARQQQDALIKQSIDHNGNWWIVHFIWLVFIVFETSPVVYKTFFMSTVDYDTVLKKKRESAANTASALIKSLEGELGKLDTILVAQNQQIHQAFVNQLLITRNAGLGSLVTAFATTEQAFKSIFDQVLGEIQQRLKSGEKLSGSNFFDWLGKMWKIIQHPVIGSIVICFIFQIIKHYYKELIPQNVADPKTLEEVQGALCLAFSSAILYRNRPSAQPLN